MALEEPEYEQEPSAQRELHDDTDDALKLEFVVNIKVFESVWSPVYALTLKAIPIERIEIAESHLFDVEQAVGRIERGVRALKVTHLEVDIASSCNYPVPWRPLFNKTFVAEGAEIRARVNGTFLLLFTSCTRLMARGHLLLC